jgi:DNA-binding transcriptional LysR family regulator
VPGTYILPSAIAAFHQAYGAVRISLELGTSAQAIDAVRGHRAEIAFVGGFAAAPEIEAEALLEDEIVVVGAPVFATQSLSRDELESRVWIFRERGSATRATVEAALGDLGIVPRRRLELPSWEAIKLAVRRGDGVTACSRFAVAEELRAGALASIVVPLWNVRRRFSAVYLRDAPLTPAAHLFLAFARRQFGEQQV